MIFLFLFPLEDSELTELKDTIDILKVKNTEAQEIIQGALSNQDLAFQGIEQAAVSHCDWMCLITGRENVHIILTPFSFLLVDRNANKSSKLH